MTNAEEKATENGKSMAFPLREIQAGLTKREYFAGLAMQGLLACGGGTTEDVIDRAIVCADELLKSPREMTHDFDSHLEGIAALPRYETDPERCENCDSFLEPGEGQLIEVHGTRTVTMNYCDRCATPVQLNVMKLSGSGLWWIFYVDDFGKRRKEIECWGLTIPEAIESFKEKWADKFDRELTKFKWV